MVGRSRNQMNISGGILERTFDDRMACVLSALGEHATSYGLQANDGSFLANGFLDENGHGDDPSGVWTRLVGVEPIKSDWQTFYQQASESDTVYLVKTHHHPSTPSPRSMLSGMVLRLSVLSALSSQFSRRRVVARRYCVRA